MIAHGAAAVTVRPATHPEHGPYFVATVRCPCGWFDDVPMSTAERARRAARSAWAAHRRLATGGPEAWLALGRFDNR